MLSESISSPVHVHVVHVVSARCPAPAAPAGSALAAARLAWGLLCRGGAHLRCRRDPAVGVARSHACALVAKVADGDAGVKLYSPGRRSRLSPERMADLVSRRGFS